MDRKFPSAFLWWIVCLQTGFRRMLARIQGAEIGRNVSIIGTLRVKKAKGARIIIEDMACIYSHPIANEVIGRRHTTLWAMQCGALVHLEKSVGCSSACICAAREIRIGEGTLIGADAMILDNDFHLPLPGWGWRNAALETAKPILIGRGCFIGTRAIILKGVTLGDGAVVGAGAVVTKDVPAEHMAFGNPAQVIPLPTCWKHGPPTE